MYGRGAAPGLKSGAALLRSIRISRPSSWSRQFQQTGTQVPFTTEENPLAFYLHAVRRADGNPRAAARLPGPQRAAPQRRLSDHSRSLDSARGQFLLRLRDYLERVRRPNAHTLLTRSIGVEAMRLCISQHSRMDPRSEPVDQRAVGARHLLLSREISSVLCLLGLRRKYFGHCIGNQ